MFTLCMSRTGHPSLAKDGDKSLTNKQVKGGYLLRYRRGFFCKGWCVEWVVLYEDSTLAWYADKCLSRLKGYVRISEAPELLAVGEWTRQVPKRPRLSKACHIGQLLAIGSRAFHDVHWLMAQSPAEINDWMTAISNTLPPPPHLPLDDKRLSLTIDTATYQKQQQHSGGNGGGGGGGGGGDGGGGKGGSNKRYLMANGCAQSIKNGNIQHYENTNDTNTNGNRKYDNDHTVLSGVCIDWGHGWGWTQASWAAETACAHETAVTSTLYCHSAEDYTMGGYDQMDWSAFADFSF